MDKTSQKVTKDPKQCDARRKDKENFMKKMKENILNDAKKGSGDPNNSSSETTNSTTNSSNKTTSSTNNSSNETTSSSNNSSNETTSVTNTVTTRSNDTYVYGVGIVAVLAIGACVFFAYNTFQPKNKKLVNEKQDQPAKRRHMLQKKYAKNE